MRWESVGKNKRKVFWETKRTLFTKEKETLKHICECKEADEIIERKRKVNVTLAGKPLQALCEYVSELEKLARKKKLRNIEE